jgi:hypothetical protein
MAKNAAGFSAKDRIDHHVYGLGTIAEVNERHTTIVFDQAGTKKFMTSVVKLTHSDAPAPAKPARRKAARSSAPRATERRPPSGEGEPVQ